MLQDLETCDNYLVIARGLLAFLSIDFSLSSWYLVDPFQRYEWYSMQDRICVWYISGNRFDVNYGVTFFRMPNFMPASCAFSSMYEP